MIINIFYLHLVLLLEIICNKFPIVVHAMDSTNSRLADKIVNTENLTVDTIISLSDKFEESKLPFPIRTMTCKQLRKRVSDETLTRNIKSVYPLMHEDSLKLYKEFLKYKTNFGSEIERNLYRDMTIVQLVNRLLRKRAAVFLDEYYLLLDKREGFGNWENVGKNNSDLKLEDCLSFDEIKLSALLSVSSYTHFINAGSRRNKGVYDTHRDNIQDEGIIIGLIGTRLNEPGVMEHQDIVITPKWNAKDGTFQRVCMDFYGESSTTYKDFKKQFGDQDKFTKLRNDEYFNNNVYKKRISLSIDTLLIEANQRAKDKGTFAYVHIVGLGLGVWKISSHQNKLYMNIFNERVEYLENALHSISDLQFAYIRSDRIGKYKNGEIIPIKDHPLGGIKIHIVNVDPHLKVASFQKDQASSKINKLLVVSYAWDGNALPGNEFWINQLDGSSDPAAACSTQVAEIHNPHINPLVSGNNLRIATVNGIEKYSDINKENATD